jgi:AraC-like DNA-binding protein
VISLKSKNICHFITQSEENTLKVKNFVFESNHAAMHGTVKLGNHAMYLTVSGSGVFVFNSKSTQAKQGSLVFGFEGEALHIENESEDFEYIYVGFSGGRAEELFRRFSVTQKNRCFDSLEGLIPFYRDCIARANEENTDLVAESVLMYSFSRLTGSASKNENIVNTALSIIEEEFNDPSLSLASVAYRLGYNAKYLSHSFKEKVGSGFSQYLRTARIKHAVLLMEHGVDSVKNIAFLCGFTDPLYFSSVFKDSLGISPKEYMQQRKSDG